MEELKYNGLNYTGIMNGEGIEEGLKNLNGKLDRIIELQNKLIEIQSKMLMIAEASHSDMIRKPYEF